jgi:hypothetical protein
MRAVAALPLAVWLLTGCGERATPADDVATGSWTTVAAAPLEPRTGAVTAWTGTEALFLGGDVDGAGPPESAADGAAYDPVTQTWRAVADAPHPIPGGTPSAVDGDTVVLVRGDRVLTYDASEDAWSVSPPAPHPVDPVRPAVLDDGTVVLADGRDELRYDRAARTWSELLDGAVGLSSRSAETGLEGWPVDPPPGAPARPGSAVWMGDDLLVLGGADADGGPLSDDAWLWQPGAG